MDEFNKVLEKLNAKYKIDMIKDVSENGKGYKEWIVGYWDQQSIIITENTPSVSGYYHKQYCCDSIPFIEDKTYLSYKPNGYITDIRINNEKGCHYKGPLILDLQGFKINLRNQDNINHMHNILAKISSSSSCFFENYDIMFFPALRAHDTFLEGQFEINQKYKVEAYTINILRGYKEFSGMVYGY